MASESEPRSIITKHADGGGASRTWPCGCRLTLRGKTGRWKFCPVHQADVTESWLEFMGKGGDDA